jgi:hypothetical protein
MAKLVALQAVVQELSQGDSYCARSLGIKKRLSKKKQNDPNTPNNLSRKRWKCAGAKSKRK